MAFAPAGKPDEYQTAYLILGHGKEQSDKCTVPPGCAVVVDAHVAEQVIVANHIEKVKPFFEYTDKKDEKEIKGKFLSPVRNYLELTETISTSGSLAIYKEGQRCPNFSYLLCAYHFMNEGYGREVMMMDSGLVEYPFYKRNIGPLRDPTIYKDKFTDFAVHPVSRLADHYDKSILPTMEQVREFIKVSAPKGVGIATFTEELMSKAPMFIISQKQLFGLVKSGRLRPGVFYNLVCRTTSAKIVEQSDETSRAVVKNSLRRLLPKEKKLLIPELRAAIREAEWHRKPFIRSATAQKFRMKVAEQEGIRTDIPKLEKQIAEAEEELTALQSSGKPNSFKVGTVKRKIDYFKRMLAGMKNYTAPFLEQQIAAWNRTRRNRPGEWKKTASGRRWTLKKANNAS